MARSSRIFIIGISMAALLAYMIPILHSDFLTEISSFGATDMTPWVFGAIVIASIMVLPMAVGLLSYHSTKRDLNFFASTFDSGRSALRSFQSKMLREVHLPGRGTVAFSTI